MKNTNTLLPDEVQADMPGLWARLTHMLEGDTFDSVQIWSRRGKVRSSPYILLSMRQLGRLTRHRTEARRLAVQLETTEGRLLDFEAAKASLDAALQEVEKLKEELRRAEEVKRILQVRVEELEPTRSKVEGNQNSTWPRVGKKKGVGRVHLISTAM